MARRAPVNLVLLSQLLWCSGASAKSSGALVVLVLSLLVLLRQKLLFTSRGSRQDACTSTTQYPVNGEYLFRKLKIFVKVEVFAGGTMVVPGGRRRRAV